MILTENPLLEEKFSEMYEAALNGYKNAYTPYSNFKVGASLLLKNGKIIYGCNIENSSYGLTNCAERTTLFKAVSEGFSKDDFVAFMIIAKTNEPVSPCGACRQVMRELMHPQTPVILTNLDKKIKETTVEKLLPYSFTGENLNE